MKTDELLDGLAAASAPRAGKESPEPATPNEKTTPEPVPPNTPNGVPKTPRNDG
jgi:hypothetical protein